MNDESVTLIEWGGSKNWTAELVIRTPAAGAA